MDAAGGQDPEAGKAGRSKEAFWEESPLPNWPQLDLRPSAPPSRGVSVFWGLPGACGAICRETPWSSGGCSRAGRQGFAVTCQCRLGVHGNRLHGRVSAVCRWPMAAGVIGQPEAPETPALIGQARPPSLAAAVRAGLSDAGSREELL